MGIKQLIFFTFFIAFLSACGGSDDIPQADKNLFSLWNKTDSNAPLGLEGGEFSQVIPIAFYFQGGEQCNCDFTVLGSQNSGTYVLNSCTYLFNSGSSDPGCDSINQTGTYSKTTDTLTINGANGVSVYK